MTRGPLPRGSTYYSDRSATFSPDRRHRYTLRRAWQALIGGPGVVFVMLNPSTADASIDDPTIRRCVGFARGWGFEHLTVVNLFAFRATDPDELLKADDPVGAGNDAVLADAAETADLVVAAWGAHKMARDRAAAVVASGVLGSFAVLGLTKDGHPRHPLYLKADARPLDPLTLDRVPLPHERQVAA